MNGVEWSSDSLPNGKILELSKNERLCRRQNKCDSEIEIRFGKSRNMEGKVENAGYHHCLLFPCCFRIVSISQGH